MLDYKKLRDQFKEISSRIDRKEIEEWLKFDDERMKNVSFINGEKIKALIYNLTSELILLKNFVNKNKKTTVSGLWKGGYYE